MKAKVFDINLAPFLTCTSSTAYYILIIFLTAALYYSSPAYSQNVDSVKTFYTNKLSVYYFDSKFPGKKTIDNIYKISFTGDSSISVSNGNNSAESLNLREIHEISFKKGKKTKEGMGIGALTGAVLGYIIGTVASSDDNGFELLVGVVVGILGIPVGGVIGGIIGSNTEVSDDYFFNTNEINKKEAIIKALEINNNKIKKPSEMQVK